MIRLASPYVDSEAIETISEILRSGNLVQGKYVNKFEKLLEKYLGVKHVILVSSGTAALHLSALALNIKDGDEVIIPSFSYPATANAFEVAGARPVTVDINLEDFCINTSSIEKNITEKTKAIVPVHEFGLPAEMDKIVRTSKKYNLDIVEDSACALGAEFDGHKAGSIGRLGCFSFHPRKAITTGEGGAISTNDSKLAGKVRALRNHGIASNDSSFSFDYAGLNYRMTEFQAALGIFQFQKLDDFINLKIEQSKVYNEFLSSCEFLRLPKDFNRRKHVYQSYHILLSKNLDRNYIIKAMKSKGIETNLGAYSIPHLPFYLSKYKINTNFATNSLKAYDRGLVLPVGNHINNRDIEYICETLTSIAHSSC